MTEKKQIIVKGHPQKIENIINKIDDAMQSHWKNINGLFEKIGIFDESDKAKMYNIMLRLQEKSTEAPDGIVYALDWDKINENTFAFKRIKKVKE